MKTAKFKGNQPQMGPKHKEMGNLCGLEPQLIKLEFIIYLPKLKVSRACRPSFARIWHQIGLDLLDFGIIFGKSAHFGAHFTNFRLFRGGRPRTTT